MSGKLSGGIASWPRYALPRGTTVHGYTIERVLGSGGFGVTYLARDDLGQSFAVKEYFPREFATRQDLMVLAASDEHAPLFADCLGRFRREAQALVRLTRAGTSNGIVRVMTWFAAHGTGFLVMEYVEGATLAGVLREEPEGLSAEAVNSLLTQLLASVGLVHHAGLLHRDIKPANIIVRDDGQVVLIDFGSSREVASGLTRTYTQIYSAGYAPLEQMIGLRQGPFSDIYAIGAVCYHAIGGKTLDALTRHLALLAGKPDPQPSAEQIGSGRYPEPLLKAIDAALTVNPEQRPQSVDVMLTALGQRAPEDNRTVRWPPPGLSEPRPSVARPRRGKWVQVALAGALVLIGTAYFMPWNTIADWQKGRQEAARQEAARQETARQDATRQEAARQEAARQATARQDAARQEAARQDAARQEVARQETARQEADRRDAVRREAEQQQAALQAARQATAPEIVADESAWSDTERRDVQSALAVLGQYHGPISGGFNADTLSAIRRWQAFAGVADSGHLSTGQRDLVLRDAERQAALLKVPAKSPHGTAADSLKGAQARFIRGSAFDRGEGQPKDPAEAAYWYALAATDGWAAAYTNLGTLHARGLGVSHPDTQAAQRLWLTAAALGEGTALFNLGALAENGLGEPVDLGLAKRWYARGAERKNAACAAALKRLGG